MTWPTPDMALQAVKVGSKLLGNKQILSLIRDVWTVLHYGRCKLVIVGPGGTAKTSLKRWLLDNNTAASVPTGHDATAVMERERAAAMETFAEIWDYPGQPDLFAKEFNHPEVNEAKRLIVIVCCAYGHHSDWGEPNERKARYATALSGQSHNLQSALEDCRIAELKFVKDLIEKHLHQRRMPIHMITAVMKQDLWYEEQISVENFYTDPDFKSDRLLAEKLSNYSTITKHLHHGRLFTHEHFPLCIRREDLRNNLGDSTVKVATTGISDSVVLGYQKLFLSALKSVVQRSKW